MLEIGIVENIRYMQSTFEDAGFVCFLHPLVERDLRYGKLRERVLRRRPRSSKARKIKRNRKVIYRWIW